LGKFATGHRYFMSFAETHCSIVSLPEHRIAKNRKFGTFFSKLVISNKSAKLSIFGTVVCSGKYVTKL
jgi:hypothetical protein